MKRNWIASDPRRDALNKAGSSLGKWLKKLSTGYFNYTPPKSGSHWTKENPEFNITQWKNGDDITQNQKDAAEAFIKDQKYDGGNSDNWEVVKEIEILLDEEKFLEADKLVSKALADGDIRKSTYTTYKETTIPNARDLKGNTFFEIPYVKNTLDVWTNLITKGSAGDAAKAVLAETYLKKHLKQWLKDNKDLDKYINNSSQLENDFIAEFDKHIVKLRSTGEFDMLFGKGVAIKDDKTALTTSLAKASASASLTPGLRAFISSTAST